MRTKGLYEKGSWMLGHISVVWAALKEAKSKTLSLATIWLDIANAYGPIPHKLIIFALHRYGVSPTWIHLIETYYCGIFSNSFSQEGWYEHNPRILLGSYHTTVSFWLEDDGCCVCFFVFLLFSLSLVPLTRSYWRREIVVSVV